MSKFLDLMDKYKFGLLAALATYIIIFMYLQMESYTQYFPIEPFHDGSYVEIPEEDVHLKPENILVPSEFSSDVKNMSRDANDTRERSYDNYYQNVSDAQVEKELRELEQQMYDEAGGEKTREQIRREMEQRQNTSTSSTEDNTPKPTQHTGNTAYAGNVMVDWSLSSRTPHQNNNWYVRNPGYTCGYGASGQVTVLIKVNQSGSVTAADYDASQSSNASDCMIQQAVKYAKMSRFNYSGSAPKIQGGRITYVFISQ